MPSKVYTLPEEVYKVIWKAQKDFHGTFQNCTYEKNEQFLLKKFKKKPIRSKLKIKPVDLLQWV